MNNVYAYIDGFNVYHALQNYIREKKINKKFGWINYRTLVSFFLSPEDELKETIFFSAIPTHLHKDKQERHKLFHTFLEHANVTIIKGRFGKKMFSTTCRRCQARIEDEKHEEKETDVALGIKVVSDILTKDVEKIILVSADTDFIPVVNYILKSTNKRIKVLIPFNASYSEPYVIKNSEHYSKEQKKRYSIKLIKEQHIKCSKFNDIVLVDDKEYRCPYS